MCGIMGYIGKRPALPFLIEGLLRLEYRGYDSCGFLVSSASGNDVYVHKSTNRLLTVIPQLDETKQGTVGIAHTRWATHGGVTEQNAHPHADCTEEIFVIHNGIIENFMELKQCLQQRGHAFASQTDTEVIPHLIEEFLKQRKPYEQAVLHALQSLRGSFAILIFNAREPGVLIGARFASPLALGIGSGEYVFASDPSPISLVTKDVVFLNDGEIAIVRNGGYEIKRFRDGRPVENPIMHLEGLSERQSKGSFDDYMLKEIHEEPDAVRNTLRGRMVGKKGCVKLGGLEGMQDRLALTKKLVITACGTAFYAGLVAKYFLEECTDIPVEVELASELRYRKMLYGSDTLLIAVSQSGETADTLGAVKEAKQKGILTLGVINVVGSTIARTVDAGVYTYAGQENAVASTKAFVSQLAALALVAVFLGRQRSMSLATGKRITEALDEIPRKMEAILSQESAIRNVARAYAHVSNFLYLGRKYNYPIALEGALKLKEVAYIHAEGYASGEMKHGPIALLDEQFPCFVLAPKDSVYEKTFSNIQEIKARNGTVIVVTTEGNRDFERMADDVIYIPETLEMLTPLVSVVPLHLFAYFVAKELGRDIDRPRNLAKSVTVE